MAAFQRIDPGGDLNTGKSTFLIQDLIGHTAELTQREATELMGWLRSFLDPLPSLHETLEACICVQQQASQDMPYVQVGDARPYQYHFQSGRWYVEVDLQHHNPDHGAAVALYRVWRAPDGFSATRVAIEAASEGDDES